jgi:uncharacterized Tic20 family protein
MHDATLRKLFSALAHASIFFNVLVVSIAVPIALLMVSEDPVVKGNAMEALNFHLNVFAWYLVCLPLVFLCVGIPLLGLVWFLSILLPIAAVIATLARPDEVYDYPFILRLL